MTNYSKRTTSASVLVRCWTTTSYWKSRNGAPSVQQFQRLGESMPSSTDTVLVAHGGPTPYWGTLSPIWMCMHMLDVCVLTWTVGHLLECLLLTAASTQIEDAFISLQRKKKLNWASHISIQCYISVIYNHSNQTKTLSAGGLNSLGDIPLTFGFPHCSHLMYFAAKRNRNTFRGDSSSILRVWFNHDLLTSMETAPGDLKYQSWWTWLTWMYSFMLVHL